MKKLNEKYQTKWDTLDRAKQEAKIRSLSLPGEEYTIIESVMNDKTWFFVEDSCPLIRSWETYHGYYHKGKFHQV